jgi:hypothetical protein
MNTKTLTARPGASQTTDHPADWPLHRILFLLAGSVTLMGVALGVTVSRWFLLLPALTGANQLLMVAAGWCPMSLLLTRLGVTSSCLQATVN